MIDVIDGRFVIVEGPETEESCRIREEASQAFIAAMRRYEAPAIVQGEPHGETAEVTMARFEAAIRDMKESLTGEGASGPTWDLFRERARTAHRNLMTRAREFFETLPPGSRVAISPSQADMLPEHEGVVRMEWTLRPVFPGQDIPPHPWVTYDFSPDAPGRYSYTSLALDREDYLKSGPARSESTFACAEDLNASSTSPSE